MPDLKRCPRCGTYVAKELQMCFNPECGYVFTAPKDGSHDKAEKIDYAG